MSSFLWTLATGPDGSFGGEAWVDGLFWKYLPQCNAFHLTVGDPAVEGWDYSFSISHILYPFEIECLLPVVVLNGRSHFREIHWFYRMQSWGDLPVSETKAPRVSLATSSTRRLASLALEGGLGVALNLFLTHFLFRMGTKVQSPSSTTISTLSCIIVTTVLSDQLAKVKRSQPLPLPFQIPGPGPLSSSWPHYTPLPFNLLWPFSLPSPMTSSSAIGTTSVGKASYQT